MHKLLLMDLSEMKALIEAAFKNVTLDGGVSQLQSEVMDNYGEGVTHSEFVRLPLREVTDDWTAFPVADFFSFSYLDAKGFRYYIPALLLDALGAGEWTSETLFALRAKKDHLWDYHMNQYSLLNAQQLSAIAQFLHWLPQLIELDYEDEKLTQLALRDYWHRYL